ncbi:MAG: HIT family protein [Planctomycetota bacterium]
MKRKNLWAPWRVKYIQGLSQESDCFLCDYYSAPQKDKENLLLWRTEHAFVVFNKFPYNNGHLLIAPVRHIASLDDASDDELMGLMGLVRDCQKALSLIIKPHGFNVGMNFGRCAGAGLPDHLHIHVVPRWNGDTNYMHVCSGTDVISQGLYELYDQLVEVSQTENLPRV